MKKKTKIRLQELACELLISGFLVLALPTWAVLFLLIFAGTKVKFKDDLYAIVVKGNKK